MGLNAFCYSQNKTKAVTQIFDLTQHSKISCTIHFRLSRQGEFNLIKSMRRFLWDLISDNILTPNREDSGMFVVFW